MGRPRTKQVSDAGAPITSAQRRKLFSIAGERGWDTDDLREKTPCGSISMLSRQQAHDLIDRLVNQQGGVGGTGGTGGSGGTGVPPVSRLQPGVFRVFSEGQRDKIIALRMQLGWTHDGLVAHLARRHYPDDPQRSMNQMLTTGDGVAVIEHLKKVLRRKQLFAKRRRAAAQSTPSIQSTPKQAKSVEAEP